MSLKVEFIKPAIGAVVHADRSLLSDPAVARECMALLAQRAVLVFPRLGLTDQEQLAFTEKLGARVNFNRSAPGSNVSAEGIYTVTLDPKINNEPEYVLGTYFYHMDGLSMEGIAPPKATVLSCRRTAPKGGQTDFASTYAAYEALTDEEKAEFEQLRVVHSLLAGVRDVISPEDVDPGKSVRKAERPLVWTDASGRKSLLIGYTADYVVGMSKAEGRALLARLLEWAGQPAFSYRHHWQEGDLVIWDNCGALHRAIPYAVESGRRMHRTSVAGVDPIR